MPNKKCILVVDDEPGILWFVSAKLTAAGYAVIVATSGEEALREARRDTVDIVLLDLFMVPMSGFLVLDRLRTFSNVPVIIFTTHPYLAEKALQLGANDVIGKPCDPDVLVSKIEKLLAGSPGGRVAGGAGRQRPMAAS
jgi:DNA-binding response OmpR family regulator